MVVATLGELTRLIFWGAGLKLSNNSTRYKVSYYETTGLYFMSSGTNIQKWILLFLQNRLIQDNLDHGASKEPKTHCPDWILRFLLHTIISVILD